MVFSILLDFCYYSKRQNRVFRGILFAVTGCVFDNGRWTAQPGTSAGPGEREREKISIKSCVRAFVSGWAFVSEEKDKGALYLHLLKLVRGNTESVSVR